MLELPLYPKIRSIHNGKETMSYKQMKKKKKKKKKA